ncbi:4-diphosphocytidyl-2-C-methyl-D-erythritol kinase [Rhodothalassium salexigens DSM 2132]|uniref:4-diphosphocytidyl-2-C-methyl-D-erythritol kinase n=2 Tax=Rhodothalassium salexigens TaxID=1086 RepID=A0A4V2SPI3_RHOSA|nr:4-(cytidine 5'-diphospho)-2-C-methyl-D-erythritol kinase [Rhodothalassium salexigens DSM 2132]TCP35276.1 4-diphosphocytidyl-2-C-methyl-D-erythritol kinase [Rhodothalassium salexigens DSM 2132]
MMSDASFLTVAAPAKVNLFLHLTGRTADGYHTLESLFVFVHVTDQIALQRSTSFDFQVTGPFADLLDSDAEDNLVMRAARLLAAEAGATAGRSPVHAAAAPAHTAAGARMVLTKRLPPAAGIGGGSSDAAATLLGLARLWNLAIAPERLATLALELGADVPACLHRAPQWVAGIGERCTPAPQPRFRALVLVNPGVLVPTAAVFKRFAADGRGFSDPIDIWPTAPDRIDRDWLVGRTRNDLEPVAIALAPQIASVLDTLRDLDGVQLARMSGSGATCFAAFDTLEAAEAAAERLRTDRPDWWVEAGHILTD